MKPLELSAGLKSSPLLARMLANNAVIQSKLSAVMTVGLIAATGWVLGQVVWLSVPSESGVTQWKAANVQVSASANDNKLDINGLQRANLFGQYTQAKPKPVVQQPVVKDAPKTRLNLVLVGVVASSNPSKGLAVIAQRGKQATYGINESIEGTRASLKAVFADRIIIDNGGRDETLMLDGAEYKKMAQPNATANASREAPSKVAVSNDRLAQIRQEITRDPQKIFQYVRLSQVKRDNQVVGYRVSPGRDAQLFNAVGLKSGDVAVQLNGNDLTDPAAMGKIFKTMSNLTEMNLTVERDGQQHDIYIQF